MNFFAVHPHIQITARARQQVFGNLFRVFVSLPVQFGLDRVGRAKHVAVHIRRRGDGIQTQFVQEAVHRLQLGFRHAVKLEGLPVGQPDGAVMTVFPGKFVQFYPLGRFDDPARQPAAQKHKFQGLEFCLGAFGADVAVVLLIHTVEADELEVVAFEAARERVFQIVQNRAA
ncbi:hypothetical protein N875_01100 [Neisseria meningitidis LNP21362]|nr:hypothetical protein N875_01100 [Neisseria meningitidis LNP21362]